MTLNIEYNGFYSFVYGLISSVVFVYDVFTFPIYLILQNPIKTLKQSAKKKTTIIDRGDDYITYKTNKIPYDAHRELHDYNIYTMTELLDYTVKHYSEKKCLGTRKILGEEDEIQPNGRVFKKYNMGDYRWLTFGDVNRMATNFGCGLRELGNEPKHPVVILAETQAKWMIAAHGAFKHNIPLVTIYATLGEEAMSYAINETEVHTVITSFALLPKFKNILKKTPKVKTVIYMEDQLESLKSKDGYREDVNVLGFNDVACLGSSNAIAETRPNTNDLAIIMYTSGSTGIPKGVKLLHRNLIASVKSFTDCTKLKRNEITLGYLPLAHVFELLVENGIMFMGMKIGYSSALTMMDNGSKIKQGTKGDVSILRPTFNCSVPVLFSWGYAYKTRWIRRGFQTPITDRIIFSATRKILGGDLKVMAVGGAPLTVETHELINTCLCMKVLHGYGLTESTACAANQDEFDMSFGRVGAPMTTALLRITNWEEGNYFVTDKPHPRGEIVVGGDVVSPGYYKNDEKTKEDFFDDKGTRWFRTGDIAEVHEDGAFKIIDRKKDLVKLQGGEYVSLGKIESLFMTSVLIDSICVYADPTKNYCIALVVPNQNNLTKLAAEKFGMNKSVAELCDDPDVIKAVHQEFLEHAKNVKLEKLEIPEKIKLTKEIWTPDNGLVTATLKLKRKDIEKFYKKDIEQMYA